MLQGNSFMPRIFSSHIKIFVCSIEARSSYKSRAIESGNNFLKAVVGQDETMIPLAVEPIATYYKQCARYEWEVDENPETEAELLKLKASQAWADMIARVANRYFYKETTNPRK